MELHIKFNEHQWR